MHAVIVALPIVIASAWGPPPSTSTSARSGVFADAELFTDADAVASPTTSTWFSQFALDRLTLGGGAQYDAFVAGYAQMETIRSASSFSAFGIDKDSLIPRARLAYGQVTPRFALFDFPLVVTARVGLIPDSWLSSLEPHAPVRGLAALPSEASGLLSPSDLGASVSLDVADHFVVATIAATNGEGGNEIERNAGKDVTAVVSVQHGVVDIENAPLVVGAQAMARDGSVGTSPVRDERVGAAVFVDHPRVHVVGEGMLGVGFLERANAMPLAAGARVDALIVPTWLGAVGTYDVDVADLALSAKNAAVQRASLGAFTDFGVDGSSVLRRARLYVLADASFGGASAGPVPGVAAASTSYGARVVLEIGAGTDVIAIDSVSKEKP